MSLAIAALAFATLLVVSLVVAATIDESLGYYAAFGALIGVVACSFAARLGPGRGS